MSAYYGKLDAAEKALRDSLARVRSNGRDAGGPGGRSTSARATRRPDLARVGPTRGPGSAARRPISPALSERQAGALNFRSGSLRPLVNKLMHGFIIIGVAIALTGCQTSGNSDRSLLPVLKQATVNGVALRYLEQGTGATVVFVHGSIADHRTWEAQRRPTASKYRHIALDQRYFGPAPWVDDGKQYSIATHANDLAAFLHQLEAGPVHLVGWSYGAAVVLVLAVQHPDLVRSLFLYEPAMATFISDPTDLKAVTEDGNKMFAGGIAALQANDEAGAVRAFVDGVNALPGTFDALPPGPKGVALENARTLPLDLAAPPPPSITCAQLGAIKAPTAVVEGS